VVNEFARIGWRVVATPGDVLIGSSEEDAVAAARKRLFGRQVDPGQRNVADAKALSSREQPS
jgi:hypothetical protein